MASLPAIRFAASSIKSTPGRIYLQCYVTPGANRQRSGIQALSHHLIKICVAAQARDGEANKAVEEVLSNALKCPKSDLEVIRGHKSRIKTIAVAVTSMSDGKEEDSILKLRERLEAAIRSS